MNTLTVGEDAGIENPAVWIARGQWNLMPFKDPKRHFVHPPGSVRRSSLALETRVEVVDDASSLMRWKQLYVSFEV